MSDVEQINCPLFFYFFYTRYSRTGERANLVVSKKNTGNVNITVHFFVIASVLKLINVSLYSLASYTCGFHANVKTL